VAWIKYEGDPYPESCDERIYLYDGISTVPISTFDCYYGPDINDSGQVVWGRGSDSCVIECEIMFYDGEKTIQFTNNLWNDVIPQINNRSQIVWQSHWITEVGGENVVNQEIFLATPGAQSWSVASTMNTEEEVSSTGLNCLFLLAIPIAVVMLWKGRRR
jgi:hypothetical protein